MSDVRTMADYLAEEIMKDTWMSKEELSDKIMASLIIMQPPESKWLKEVKDLRLKLGTYKREKKEHAKRMKFERDYWKNKVRNFVQDYEMRMMYEELDGEMGRMGYE